MIKVLFTIGVLLFLFPLSANALYFEFDGLDDDEMIVDRFDRCKLTYNTHLYWNTKFCSEISFIYISHTKESANYNVGTIKKRINNIAKEICPKYKIVYEKEVKVGTFWFPHPRTDGKIICPNAKKLVTEANLKRDEEHKKQIEAKQKEIEKKKKKNKDIEDSQIIAASSGTGFFVSTNGHMVTNNHVIDSCDIVKAHYQGRELDANVLFTDGMNDLAIIKANLKPNTIFPVSNEDVSLLEDIIVAGYPLGKDISSSIKTFKGSVTSLSGKDNNFSNFQIDAALNRGNSGGPIVDQKGNVVGVAVAKWIEEGVEGFNFGVKSSTLKTFASSNQFKFQDPSTEELSNKELGQLITEATIYLECWMSVAKIKQIIEEGERQKAFFSEYK